MSNVVAKIETQSAPESATLLAVISRAASDPAADVEKMERLMAMYERNEARKAEAEFADALAAMQVELPSIGERGNAANRYTYALWEDVNAAIKPVLAKHGFALSFRTSCADGITVTGVLSHRAGHREETSITLPSDTSGNKNAVQAVASSVSYGKRYTAGALLNLTSHGEDDDAFAAAAPVITEEQLSTLRDWIANTASNEEAFCAAMKIGSLEAMPATKFQSALAALKRKADQLAGK